MTTFMIPFPANFTFTCLRALNDPSQSNEAMFSLLKNPLYDIHLTVHTFYFDPFFLALTVA